METKHFGWSCLPTKCNLSPLERLYCHSFSYSLTEPSWVVVPSENHLTTQELLFLTCGPCIAPSCIFFVDDQMFKRLKIPWAEGCKSRRTHFIQGQHMYAGAHPFLFRINYHPHRNTSTTTSTHSLLGGLRNTAVKWCAQGHTRTSHMHL